MQFKKIVLCACAAATLAIGSAAAQARDLLRVGTEPTFAPFEFLDTQTKDYTGFDMDLIRAVGQKAGFDVQILNMGFDALIPMLRSPRKNRSFLSPNRLRMSRPSTASSKPRKKRSALLTKPKLRPPLKPRNPRAASAIRQSPRSTA